MSELAPILLFTYIRLDTLKQAVSALQNNILAKDSELFIFSDAAKAINDVPQINAVREYLSSVTGFKQVTIYESLINKGLANSIIDGVTQIINNYEKVIVLEDDLLISSNFLSFMNQSLKYYENNHSVISISGYNMAVTSKKDYPYDIYFALRSASWGWATWKEKWTTIDWKVKDFNNFSSDKYRVRSFNKMGSDMFNMLKKQQKGLNNSWAIRYCYHQFTYNLYTVYPVISKVKNIGFDEKATHTFQKYNRFDVDLDNTTNIEFKFSDDVFLDEDIIAEFRKLNGFRSRFISRVRNLINL